MGIDWKIDRVVFIELNFNGSGPEGRGSCKIMVRADQIISFEEEYADQEDDLPPVLVRVILASRGPIYTTDSYEDVREKLIAAGKWGG